MSFIRAININKHYSKKNKRLAGMAFRPSSTNGGISVFDKDCAIRDSGTICRHIERFYAGIAGTPIVFWEVPDGSIPPLPCVVEPTDSDSGDKCHYEFFNWDYEDAENTIRDVPVESLEICTDEGIRKFQLTDLPK